jgi:exosortase
MSTQEDLKQNLTPSATTAKVTSASVGHRLILGGIIVTLLPTIDWTIEVWANSILGGMASALLAVPIALILTGIASRTAPASDTIESMTSAVVLCFLLVGCAVVTGINRGDGAWMLLVGCMGVSAVWVWSVYVWGWGFSRHLTLPVFFTLFALPWEYYLRAAIQVTLQEWTTDIAMSILKLSGYAVWYFNSYTIDSEPYYLIINETCSGINMLVSLAMYTLIFGWLVKSRMSTRLALMAMVFPIAMFANGLRVTTIYLLGFHGGPEWADGVWHTGSAYVLFVPVFWFIYVLSGFFERRFLPPTKSR